MQYPDDLEAWWLNQLELRYPGLTSEKQFRYLEQHVAQLSDFFTKERDTSMQKGYQKKELLLAYGLFFFPQTYTRFQFPLQEALQYQKWNLFREHPFRILDLGSGIGASTISAVDFVCRHRNAKESLPIEVCAVDRSTANLSLLKRLVNDVRRFPKIRWSYQTADMKAFPKIKSCGRERWDLISSSFALGEAFMDQSIEELYGWVEKLVDKLTDDGVVVLTEPALKETSQRLQYLRNHIVEEGKFYIWGPCLHHEKCPMLEGKNFWCHEVRNWKVPSSLEILNRHLFRSIKELKFSFLILSKRPPQQNEKTPELFRLTAPVRKTAGKHITAGCAADGRLLEYDRLTRGMSKEEKKAFLEQERGNIVKAEKVTPLGGEKNYRIDSDILTLSGFAPSQKSGKDG